MLTCEEAVNQYPAWIGTIMGKHGINIASMSLGRDKQGGKALTVLNLDSAPTEAVIAEIRKDTNGQYQTALFLGDVNERVKVLFRNERNTASFFPVRKCVLRC